MLRWTVLLVAVIALCQVSQLLGFVLFVGGVIALDRRPA